MSIICKVQLKMPLPRFTTTVEALLIAILYSGDADCLCYILISLLATYGSSIVQTKRRRNRA